ncbi:MAG: LytTR family transcriptional regulator [Lachnospiraceae bacterium]|jgi:DNA-binding LytR/AlgR family response regulator|nr:LytTR family transcriptional regulator [Lachnospiraceae bacterium]
MKVELQISENIDEPYIVIHSNKMTAQIQQIMEILQSPGNVITVMDNDQLIVLEPSEIYMLRMEDERLNVYCQQKKYVSGKRLYEMEKILGSTFMRISKSTLINLKQISRVESSFHGSMLVILKNGNKDYISRKYLPDFKKYLGI